MDIEALHNVAFLAGIEYRQRQRRRPEQPQGFIGEHPAGHGAQRVKNRRQIPRPQTDGGKMASKPYASSGAYINRMSDFCKGCVYQGKQKTGPQGLCDTGKDQSWYTSKDCSTDRYEGGYILFFGFY